MIRMSLHMAELVFRFVTIWYIRHSLTNSCNYSLVYSCAISRDWRSKNDLVFVRSFVCFCENYSLAREIIFYVTFRLIISKWKLWKNIVERERERKKKIDRGLTRVHFNLNKVKLVEESDFHNACSEYRDWPI